MTTLAPTLRPDDVAGIARAAPATRSDVDPARRGVRLALVLCLAVHVWLISAGHWALWPRYTARYDLLARAFAAGQTNLLIAADPRHLALPDPYDPAANRPFRMVPGVPDSCLYGGRFYLYWGPVPALLLVPVRALLGPSATVGDQFLCFAFAQGMTLATAGLLLRLRARHFPASPAWLPAVGLAVAALSTPAACAMTRSAVYEAAILGGQCFLLAGIYLAWRGVMSDRREGEARPCRSEITAPRPGPLFLAGTCLAAAVGCRVSLAVAVVAVGLLVTGRLALPIRRRPTSTVLNLLAFGLPLVAGAVALGWYNHVRFDSWSEFGQRYQLAGANLRSYPSLFGLDNLWPGLWSYFLRPVAVVGHFPFLLAVAGDGTFPSFFTLPPHYESFEPITGMVWVMPFLWLLPVGAAALVGRAGGPPPIPLSPRERAGVRANTEWPSTAAFTSSSVPVGARPHPSPLPRGQGTGVDLAWILTTLSAAAVLGFLPVLLMIGSSQRYLVDFTPPLVVVAAAVLWRLTDVRRTTPARARRRLAVGVALAAVTVALGLLVSIEGYSGHFRFNNPPLFYQLSGGRAADLPEAPAPQPATHAES